MLSQSLCHYLRLTWNNLAFSCLSLTAVPIHWIYDASKLEQLIGDKESIEFHDPPGNPYYRIDTGRNSCYGDQAYVLLESLVECKGITLLR